MSDQVSIVVPVYNVGPYLQPCLDSLTAQDYDNLQIILVDDGSTDGSGAICDQYAAEHAGAEVIHQKNQGLSAARNAGTHAATGTYIAYIDSDDWVSPDYIRYQMKLMKQYDADVVAVKQGDFWEGQEVPPLDYANERVEAFENPEAMIEMCYGFKFGVSACKLFRKSVVEPYPFPVGALYEDLAVMYRVIGDARRVVYSNLPMYHYRRRAGSIINQSFDKRHLAILTHADQLYEYVRQRYPEALRAAAFRSAYVETQIIPMVVHSGRRDVYHVLRARARKLYRTVMADKRVMRKYKVRLTAIVLGYGASWMEVKAEDVLKRLTKKNLSAG